LFLRLLLYMVWCHKAIFFFEFGGLLKIKNINSHDFLWETYTFAKRKKKNFHPNKKNDTKNKSKKNLVGH